MKDYLLEIWRTIADHPASYGFLAALARWSLGPRKREWAHLLGQVTCSCFVAWVASYWFKDEVMTDGKRMTFIILLSFIARDLLAISLLMLERAKDDPLGFVERVIQALKGGPKS